MTTAQKYLTNQITGVAETLMIPLYARYVETTRNDSIIKDEKAVELVERIDYDFTKFANGWASQLGCVIRVKTYDQILQRFIQQHPNAVIINLGSGLCTRFFRIDNGQIRWYEVDFPEVIELRRKLIPETERYQFIAKSFFDFTWMNQIQRDASQSVFIIIEGTCMYLTEVQNQLLFQVIAHRFSGAEMMIDVISPFLAKNSKRHDTVSKVNNAEFHWGIKNIEALETWGMGIKVLKVNEYLTNFAKYPHRLKGWMKHFLFILVPLYKTSGRIVRMQIGTS